MSFYLLHKNGIQSTKGKDFNLLYIVSKYSSACKPKGWIQEYPSPHENQKQKFKHRGGVEGKISISLVADMGADIDHKDIIVLDMGTAIDIYAGIYFPF